jgi:hypothetical protein
MKKFTFKTVKPTGRYSSFFSDQYLIKFNKVEVGEITDNLPIRIRLKVYKDDLNEDGNPNCSWKWITLKKTFNSIDEAKLFLNNNRIKIHEKCNLVKLQ